MTTAAGPAPPASLVVREAGEGDCAAIATLLRELAREDAHDEPDPDAVTRAVRACLEGTSHELLVAAVAGAVVGYLAVHWIPFPMLQGTEGYVSDLVVARERRAAGIGGVLLAEAERRARERGCTRLMLNNRIAAESFRRGFYAQHGFRRRDEFANLVKRLR